MEGAEQYFCTESSNPTMCSSSIQEKYFLLELKNGFLRLMYDFGFSSGPQLLENNIPKLQINDARYHEVRPLLSFNWLDGDFVYVWGCQLSVSAQVSVIYHQSKKVILLVDKSHVKSMENPKTTLPFSDIYIGGAPSSILKSRYHQMDNGILSTFSSPQKSHHQLLTCIGKNSQMWV